MDNLNAYFPIGEANARAMKLFVAGNNLFQGKAWIANNQATEVHLIGTLPWWPPDRIDERERHWVVDGKQIVTLANEPES